MFSAPFLAPLLDRVTAIVRRVARPMAERARLAMAVRSVPVRVDEPISPILRGLAQGWLSARLRALSALMRRIEAGETCDRPEPPSHAAVAEPLNNPAKRVDRLAPDRLPCGFGWMCDFGPNVSRDGAAFAAWLSTPWMMAKVLAAPEQMAGLIGPILTATGQCRPDWFPTVGPRARRPNAKTTLPPCGGPLEAEMASRGSGEVSSPDSASPGLSPATASPGSSLKPTGAKPGIAVPHRTSPPAPMMRPRPRDDLGSITKMPRRSTDGGFRLQRWTYHVGRRAFYSKIGMNSPMDRLVHFVLIS
jgi:hypothetical protein